MKKRALMALPKLTATDEMKQIAASDLPRKEKTTYGYVREVCEYYAYLRCITQDGILKVAFFLPEHLRLNGSNPAYEVYLDKEKRQFITYNSLTQKWCESKLDRLDWKRLYWYAKTSWVSEEDMTAVQTYLGSDKKAVDAILQFQRDVRDEQLEQRHRRETDPWDKDMEQVPELPKDWSRWVDKVAIRQNYIYYHYKKGGAKTGYCSLSQHAAAGMSYIDTKTGEEGIDFLADFEKADSTEKPDKHIAGNGFFSHSVYLSLHIAFGDSGKSRLAEQAGENCDCKGRKQKFFEFLQG